MIVREILDNPDEVLASFDWFNDYKDTRRWVAGNGRTDLVSRMDDDYEAWRKDQGINKRVLHKR